MSQERTRFPIQPQERRISAESNEDVALAPEEAKKKRSGKRGAAPPAGSGNADKPTYPPHERHEH